MFCVFLRRGFPKWGMQREEFIIDSPAACAMILGMRFLPRLRRCAAPNDEVEGPGVVAVMEDSKDAGGRGEDASGEDSHLLKTVGWISAALGAVALGLIVGREIRERYKFNRRTPYDLYAHSGDELPEADCGVGI